MSTQSPKRPFGSQVLEPGSECIKLLYNRPSNCVIAHFVRLTKAKMPINELYYRRAEESDYTKATIDDPFVSYCDPVSCKHQPYVFFNIVRWDKAGTGFDWVALAKLSLIEGTIERVLDSNSLRLPSSCTRAWLSSIIDIDEDGTVITCTLALEVTTAPYSGKVEYSISDLVLATGEHNVLVPLPHTFV